MAKAKKELSTFQRAIAIITLVALVGYSIINVALVVNAYSQLDNNVGEFADILANWQKGAVIDIKVQKNCDAGYETALQDRTWPGVQAGCFCGGISQATLNSKNVTCGPFCFSSCDANAKSVGCKDVSGRGPQLLNNWGVVGTDSYQICVKRSLDTWSGVATKSTGACPAGTVTCGTGDNKFCAQSRSDAAVGEECPISSMTVTNTDAAGITNCLNPATKGCRVLANTATDKRVMWLKRNDSNILPLVEFTSNEYSMCVLKTKTNLTPGRSLFALLNDKPTTCGIEGITRWSFVDSIYESTLFQANGLSSYITSLNAYSGPNMAGYYPSGTDGTKFNWTMYTRSFIPFKASCRDRLEPLISKKTFIDDLRNAQLAMLIIGVIASFFLGVPLAFMEIQNLRGVDLSCIEGKGEEERKKLKRIKKFINYGFKGLQLPFQIWAIVLAGTAKGLFIDISDEQCSTAPVNAVLIFLANALTKTYSSNLSALGILAATLLLDILLDCWERRKKKQDQEKNQEIGNASIASNSPDTLRVAELDESNAGKMKFGKPTPVYPQPQLDTQMQQGPPQAQGQAQPTIVIQLTNPVPQQLPQQYPQQQQQQYPAQQYPPPQQQYPPQQYPAQQYPPPQQQYPAQQYPPQQQQQQYPPQQYPPQQQYPGY